MRKKMLSLLAIMMAGEAVTFLPAPRAQIRAWSSPSAPRWYRRMMSYFDDHRTLCRALAGLELAGAAAVLRSASRAR
jgi:hypothetical protein